MTGSSAVVSFLGLRLKRDVSLVAFLAFVMSASSLGIQIAQHLRGPQIQMSAGERVNLILLKSNTPEDQHYVMINARLNYLNTGALGRDSVIERERLHIYFGDPKSALPYEYRWLHHELFVANPDPDAKILRGAVAINVEGAHSFVTPGAGTASHQTTFVAFQGAPVRSYPNGTGEIDPDPAWVPWTEFIRKFKRSDAMILRFIASDLTGQDLPAYDCQVALKEKTISDLQMTGWATALCLPLKRKAVSSKRDRSN